LVGLALAALVFADSRLTPVRQDELLLSMVLAAAMALAWLFPIPIAPQTKYYVDTAVIIAAALLLQPAMALTAVGSGTLIAHAARRKSRDLAQAFFNTATVMLIVGTVILFLIAGGWGPRRSATLYVDILPYLVVAGIIIYVLSVVFVSTIAALETSVPVLTRVRLDLTQEPGAEMITHAALVTVGFLAALVASVHPLLLLLMGIPVAAIYVTLNKQNQARLEAERARMMSDDALAEAQRLARVGSWEWLPQSDRWSWSDEGARLMELPLGDQVPSSQHVLEAIHPEDRAQVAALLQAARHEPRSFVVDHRVVIPGDDRERVVQHRAEFHGNGHGAYRYLGTIQDMTERVQVESAMREAKEAAEAADRAKTHLLSMASHDLRTPLTSIQGYLEMVLNGSLGNVPSDQREFLEVAHRNTQHLTQLVSDLLNLARIEAGQFPLYRRAIDVSEIIEEILEILEPRAVLKHLRIEAMVAPDCPQVDADPERLHQVLLNVVDNAIKFTDQGAVLITAMDEGEQVAISVTDTGRGIDPAALPYIFEVFRQAGDPAQRASGSGLGLAIVQQFVTLHGGTIGVESELGKGTTVTIRLPAASATPASSGDATPSD
jgi:signal transduction histidine kinase